MIILTITKGDKGCDARPDGGRGVQGEPEQTGETLPGQDGGFKNPPDNPSEPLHSGCEPIEGKR